MIAEMCVTEFSLHFWRLENQFWNSKNSRKIWYWKTKIGHFFLYRKSNHQMGWKKKIIFKNVKKTDFVQCFFNVCENDQRNFWIVWECWIMWECELVTCWWWPSSFHTDVIFAQETTVACWPAAQRQLRARVTSTRSVVTTQLLRTTKR